MPMRAYLLSLLMMTVSLAGCINDEGSNVSGIGDTTEDELALPDWQIGDQWLYTFITPEFGEDSTRLVVADVREDDGQFMLGISSEAEAQRHAVINHNPFLGRVTMDGLSVYENGEPQPVFNFPWEVGNTWNFRLLGQDWSASTDNIYNGEVTVSATSDDGHELGDGGVDDVLVEAGDVVEDLLVEGGGVLAVGGLGHDGQGGGLVQAEDGAGDGEAAAPRPGVLDALVDAAIRLRRRFNR